MDTGSEMILEMLRRSYFAADGLWFVMLEEEDGLEHAMDIDERVWRVMPKIQARKARELMGVEDHTPAALVRCMALKFAAEGHRYDLSVENQNAASLVISKCPWREILEDSGREHLGPQIADRICATEAAVWAEEFSPEVGPPVEAELVEAICHGDEHCRVVFRTRTEEVTDDE